MKPRIHLILVRGNGERVDMLREEADVTDDMRAVAEDLLHTLSTGSRPALEGLYELCAEAFGTTREDAKERLLATSYGMTRKTFNERLRLA